jgi:hypothetical protein
MHYSVSGLVIRSENAAKPYIQRSQYLTDFLRSLPYHRRALDFGCGKLRYADILARNSLNLTLVDSDEQLGRIQMLRGQRTTIDKYAARHWPHATVLRLAELAGYRHRHDFALCTNVLSAIPSRKVRSRALELLRRSLDRRGTCLFVCQYRNSHYRDLAESGKAKPHLDGWLLESKNGGVYYGLLPKAKLGRVLESSGFTIRDSWTKGESVYALAGPQRD